MLHDMDGTPLAIGDFIGWKNGIEQGGKIVRFQSHMIIASQYDSDTGERYEVSVSPNKCWVEG